MGGSSLQKIDSGKIWGGNLPANSELNTGRLALSLFSGAPRPAGSGDILYLSVDEADRWTRLVLIDGEGPAVEDLSRWWFQVLTSIGGSGNERAVLSNFIHLASGVRQGARSRAALLTFDHKASVLDCRWTGDMSLIILRAGGEGAVSIGSPKNGANGKAAVGERRRVPLKSGDRIFLGSADAAARGQTNGGPKNALEKLFVAGRHRKIHLVKRKILRKLFHWAGESPGPAGVSFLIAEVR